jgi:heme exporter protein A
METSTLVDNGAKASTSAGAPLLIAHDLACRRGARWLFEGLALTLGPSEIVWLRGPNGQGKTSLMRLLSGLARPERGAVARAPEVVYLAHANALKDDLSVAESLRFLGQLHGHRTTPDALLAALARFRLVSRRDAAVRTLSQGQRRRVALARLALAPPGALWLLDEPFDALDAEGSEILNALLLEHADGRGAALLTSHVAPSIAPARLRCLQLQQEAIA